MNTFSKTKPAIKRRRAAIGQLDTQLHLGTKRKGMDVIEDLSKEDITRIQKELEILKQRT